MINFTTFLQTLIVEEIHPELQKIITSGSRQKQEVLSRKIRELTSRGEKTGIEGNMSQGSSRAYLKHEGRHPITLDGRKTFIRTGTKVAIRAHLDQFHNKDNYGGLRLGAMQNRAEGTDKYTNNNYRILVKDQDKPDAYHSNKENGIFPPLIEHDHKTNQWSHVGHVRNINKAQFQQLTKAPDHPEGIHHLDFVDALNRSHRRSRGEYWEGEDPKHEKYLDHVDTHPLIQKFAASHINTGAPPDDYEQIKNLGVFHHPDGSKHIVARDHGFDPDVEHAYSTALAEKERQKHRVTPMS